MISTRDPPVMAKKKPGPKKSASGKRDPNTSSIHIYKDVAGWLAEISTCETERLKEAGVLTGYEMASVAKIVDGWLREWAWQRVQRVRRAKVPGADRLPVPPCPPPPGPTIEAE